MILGVPKEIKTSEHRVALTPAGARAFTSAGQRVLVEAGAGLGSGFEDEAYRKAGASLAAGASEIWGSADMILKVKEPQPAECRLARRGQAIFTYFHFAADRGLTEALLASGAHCFAYETLVSRGSLPLLTPMSEVAGRMSVQEGAKYLEKHHGGRGVLLGGVPGVEPAHVLVLGGGTVGTNAAWIAAGMGARVAILDINLDRLRYLSDVMPANVSTVYSSREAILERLPETDLLIGGVLVTGARAPRLVRKDDLKLMPKGAVIVDVAVDQGGCVETCRATTHDNPTFVVDGVVHYCVANMPGAVARTSTYALTNATLPFALRLAELGPKRAVLEDDELASAANIVAGQLTHPGVAEAFELPCREARTVAAAI
ncbi:MAG: alanine dehydrogenase [Planctomycetota bacterium]|nr:MAG: alanine dehydrogenase [Planctomycetota bacterium]